jgi:hypothetical protein
VCGVDVLSDVAKIFVGNLLCVFVRFWVFISVMFKRLI